MRDLVTMFRYEEVYFKTGMKFKSEKHPGAGARKILMVVKAFNNYTPASFLSIREVPYLSKWEKI
jgi:hypothetical protein